MPEIIAWLIQVILTLIAAFITGVVAAIILIFAVGLSALSGIGLGVLIFIVATVLIGWLAIKNPFEERPVVQ